MLSVQEQKLALEVKQAEIAIREIDHNQKIADKSIEAQANDRKDQRQAWKSVHLQRLIFAGFVLVLVLGFIIWALSNGKDAFILDFAKIAVGFAGGYGTSQAIKYRAPPKDSDAD